MIPDSKIHWANMGPTWVLSAPDGSHVGPMKLAIRDVLWCAMRWAEVRAYFDSSDDSDSEKFYST